MLTDLRHGKLINFGGERVEHEFVNCHETTEHRRAFHMDTTRWSTTTESCVFQEIVLNLLRDWGTGLDRGLYVEAVVHLLGGLDLVRRPVGTIWNSTITSQRHVNLVASGTAFEITCLRGELDSFERHLVRFLANTDLKCMFWVNVASGNVRFVELSK